jgi:Uncharacterized protein conserved in bacteria (DUF2147)
MKLDAVLKFATLLPVLATSAALAQSPSSQLIGGNWALEDPNDTAFRFEPCGVQICARVVALGAPGPDSVPATDARNPNPSLRTRPVCGLQVIQGLTPDRSGWKGGSAYNPGDGTDLRFRINRSRDGNYRVVVAGLPAFIASVPLVPAARNLQRPCQS